MFRNAKTRDWIIVSAVCFAALTLLLSFTGLSSAFRMKSSGSLSQATVTETMAPNCPLPSPAPTCTANQTLCSEGTGGASCHATVYTCSGTPPTWDGGSKCNYNACTGTPGTVGSKCQP